MNYKWLFNRLRAMSFRELLWRIHQKGIKKFEKKKLKNLGKQPIYSVGLSKEISLLQPDILRLPINWNNNRYSLFDEQNLLGEFSYEQFKTAWNAGFQTENAWPEDKCTYDIPYAQRTDIGDIRTNWELNRHYQFANLAKSYYLTADGRYLAELIMLFDSWNEHNPFLCGVEWASPMEIAIRVNSWIYTYIFIKKAMSRMHDTQDKRRILDLENKLNHGIKAMTSYILRHYSRFSSANNHLIIELYAVCLSGLLYDYDKWIDFAVSGLTRELSRQNYSDGVNKEMSLHYQCLDMEVYGLLLNFLRRSNHDIPEQWYFFLQKMSEFTCDCCGDYGETVIFGDDDGGKILDLCGVEYNYYHYVLELMSLTLDVRYSDLNKVHENICWLFEDEEIRHAIKKRKYLPPECHCYKEGGYTILRSTDRKILIGMDHAELGFGKIAAHGHSDALSFQIFYEGIPVFVDPGTFNYHITPAERNYFRETKNHNTVFVEGKNQSEMLGPFLWGEKAECKIEKIIDNEEKIGLVAIAKYRNIEHKRIFTFNKLDKIEIEDHILGAEGKKTELSLMFGPDWTMQFLEESILILSRNKFNVQIRFWETTRPMVSIEQYSPSYNKKVDIQGIHVCLPDKTGKTVITILETCNGNHDVKKTESNNAGFFENSCGFCYSCQIDQ